MIAYRNGLTGGSPDKEDASIYNVGFLQLVKTLINFYIAKRRAIAFSVRIFRAREWANACSSAQQRSQRSKQDGYRYTRCRYRLQLDLQLKI